MKKKFDVLFKVEVYSDIGGGCSQLISVPGGGGCSMTFEAESPEQAKTMALTLISEENGRRRKRQAERDGQKAKATGN